MIGCVRDDFGSLMGRMSVAGTDSCRSVVDAMMSLSSHDASCSSLLQPRIAVRRLKLADLTSRLTVNREMVL